MASGAHLEIWWKANKNHSAIGTHIFLRQAERDKTCASGSTKGLWSAKVSHAKANGMAKARAKAMAKAMAMVNAKAKNMAKAMAKAMANVRAKAPANTNQSRLDTHIFLNQAFI